MIRDSLFVIRDSALRFALMAATLTALASSESEAQAELRGRVVSDSGVPIPNATVTLASIGYAVRSDSLGTFRLSGTPGSTLSFSLRASGFRDDSATVVLTRGRVVTRDFVMVSEVTPLPEPNPSDRVLSGRVTDPANTPLSYVNIQVNYGRRYVSDDSGRFTLPRTSSGSFTLFFRRIGFELQEVSLPSMPDTALRVVMNPVAHRLPETKVTGKAAYVSLDLHGFYRRMEDAERGINHGYFITPEDLERKKPTWISQMADGFPTVRVTSGNGRGRRHPLGDVIEGTNNCKMTVYLDNIRIVGRLNGRDDLVNQMVLPSHVAGMEIYPRAVGAPPQYQSQNGTCGVVLIWTK